MNAVKAEFTRRADECQKYLDLLAFVEAGSPGSALKHAEGEFKVETIHEQVLKASVYLHLYNLVESTVNRAFEVLTGAICVDGACFHDLTDHWRMAWLEFKTADLEEDQERERLIRILAMTSALVDRMPVDLKPKLPAGSLDEKKIAKLAAHFGLQLNFRDSVVSDGVDSRPLERVKENRNKLAHGHRSFSDCGKDPSVSDLRKDYTATRNYLEDFLDSFAASIARRSWRRALPAAATVATG